MPQLPPTSASRTQTLPFLNRNVRLTRFARLASNNPLGLPGLRLLGVTIVFNGLPRGELQRVFTKQ